MNVGHHVTHRHNPDLGIGRVVAIEARTVTVEFPRKETVLRLASGSDVLVPVELGPGRKVRLGSGEEAEVAGRLVDERIALDDGRIVAIHEVWPVDLDAALADRLAAGSVDPLADFLVRKEALHLLTVREASGLGTFLGGRIRLFPHQLHVAERATASLPVRWLLADEVGLGKTIEACLVLNRLVRSGQVERILVIAPATLTVQWLGELWRKYHQVFALLDEARLADVARDFGPEFNPFDAHRRAVVALETLVARPGLTEQAVAAGIDLLIVDEAHRLRRPPGHPGEPAWRAVAPIAALDRHVLLLSAVPLEDDAHGFFRLLQLLRPADLPEEASFEERLARREPLPPCTSSTRRADIGGLPPRAGSAIALEDDEGSRLRKALLDAVAGGPADRPTARRAKADRVHRALASGAALQAVLRADEGDLSRIAAEADAQDPRLSWLLARAPAWKRAGEKTLVFVAHRETLEMLRTALTHRAQLASGVFHEELSPARRDIEVARFRLPEGPSLLVSTECGGEGRNFEFCRRLVLFDLPWDPGVVEQRIGRLDRIGRSWPVEIVYFRPPDGLGADVVRLFERLGLFAEPLAGLEPQLAGVETLVEEAAVDAGASLTEARIAAVLDEAQAARSRIREAAYRELHRDRYQASMADAILARVPADLDGLNQDVVVRLAERLGFTVERQRGTRRFSIEIGNEALVDGLPGVPGGSSFLGTFDREEAVADEALDFFAAGHPLVEGLLAHLEDAPLGRVAAFRAVLEGAAGFGLLALYKDGPAFEAVAVDAEGRLREDWAAAFARRRVKLAAVPAAVLAEPRFAPAVRRLAARLDPQRRPVALLAIWVSASSGP
jgi:ATP-dependent helicase HepA